MNAEDKFECRHQEIHDAHTGVTVTFGTHVTTDPTRDPRQGLRWLRIAVPYAAGPTGESVETKTSTVTFGPDGQALKILPHMAVPDSTATPESTEVPDSPRAHEIKEELHHLDEVEASLHDGTVPMQAGEPAKVDKSHKHGKK